MSEERETAAVGGPRDRGFREESPLRPAGFITVRASRGNPTHRHNYRHSATHVYLVFMGSENPSSDPVMQRSNVEPNFSTQSPFLPGRSLTLPILFFTPSLSPALLGRLSAGLLSDREGFVRCQIPELRDQRQTKDW